MCQSGEQSQLWFWSQPENVPPRLVDPWVSHFTSLSRSGFFLHPSARQKAGIGQVRREGQVCRGQRWMAQDGQSLGPGGGADSEILVVLVRRAAEF